MADNQGAQEVEWRDVASLVPYANNARVHTKKQVRQIAQSIKEYGFNNPVLVDAKGTLVAGHGRLLAAASLKMEKVPAIVLGHLTPAQARAYCIADNKLAEGAKWDDELLSLELLDLSDDGVNLAPLGFLQEELDALFERAKTDLKDTGAAAGGEDGDEDEDEEVASAPAAPEGGKARSRRGEVYELGPHRLMCGDSTSVEDVAKLLAGTVPDCLLMDPPYCSGGFQEAGRAAGGIGSKRKDSEGKEYTPKIANDQLSTRGYMSLIRTVLERFSSPLIYVWTDWRMWVNLFETVESNGFGVRNMLVLDKGTPGMGRGWRTQHELVMFAAKATARFDNHKAVGNVLSAKRTGNPLHPTQKPVSVLRTILQVTDFAKVIADPFAGSGSTLVACEEEGRTFYGMELDPGFCDVARMRWTSFAKERGLEPGPGELY